MVMSILTPKLTLIMLTAYLLTSCGDKHKRKDDHGLQKLILTNKPPAQYTLHDLDCQKAKNPVEIETSAIWGWNSGFQVTSSLTDLDHTATYESLESRFVSGTGFSKLFERTCPSIPGRDLCLKDDGSSISYQTNIAPNPLRICQSGIEFPRDTYEAIALTSLHYINKAAGTYENFTGKTMSKIRLEVMPLFETTESNVKGLDGKNYDVKYYVTDNLAYFPLLHTVMVFPQGKQSADSGHDRFWESSFVLAHELGHHIEEMRIGTTMRAAGLQWNAASHSYISIQEEPSLAFSNKNGAEKIRMWTAISEAFADLVAFYSDQESLSSLENLDCIGKNRNVTARVFGDGKTSKILNDNVYNEMLTGRRLSNDCDAIEYADPHIVGAIVAHILHETFRIATDNLAPANRLAKKYQFAMEWLDAIVYAYARSKNEPNVFKHHKVGIETALYTVSEAQKKRICALHVELMPLVPPPFESTCEKRRLTFN